MQRGYELIKGNLLTGGFAQLGITGMINKHIKSVEKISDTEVQWLVENDYGETYRITVTATKPTGEDDKRTDPVITIAEVVS